MGTNARAPAGVAPSLHQQAGPDSPLVRAMEMTAQQAARARRAEATRQRQRAALLELMARTMEELRISMSELSEARRSGAARASRDKR